MNKNLEIINLILKDHNEGKKITRKNVHTIVNLLQSKIFDETEKDITIELVVETLDISITKLYVINIINDIVLSVDYVIYIDENEMCHKKGSIDFNNMVFELTDYNDTIIVPNRDVIKMDSLELDFRDDSTVEIGGIEFDRLTIEGFVDILKDSNVPIYDKGILFYREDVERVLDGFVENTDYSSKQAIIQRLIAEDLEFDDDGSSVTVRTSGTIFGSELLLSYEIRFNEDDEMYEINKFVYHYETESILINELVEYDEMIDELYKAKLQSSFNKEI